LPDPFAPPSSTAVTPDPADMHCAGHWVTSGNNGNGGGAGNVSTWVNDALTDGVDITTMRDASGNQANCFTSLSVGSNRSLTIPANWNGPLYINGGNVNLQGAFTCASCAIVLTNKDPTSNTIGTFSSNAQATNNI